MTSRTSKRRKTTDEDGEGGDGTVTFDLVTPATVRKSKRLRKESKDDSEDELCSSRLSASTSKLQKGQDPADSSPLLRRSERRSKAPEMIDDLLLTPPPTVKKPIGKAKKTSSLETKDDLVLFATPSPRVKRSVGRSKKTLDSASKSLSKPVPRKLVGLLQRQPVPTVRDPPPSFLDLPKLAMERILGLLDVDSMENLSQTCSYFDQLICGNFITSLNFPFDESFIQEIHMAKSIEKKPLLRLACDKSKTQFKGNMKGNRAKKQPIFDVQSLQKVSIQKIISSACSETIEYFVYSQLSFLSLNQLKEVNLIPENFETGIIHHESTKTLDNYKQLDTSILKVLQSSDCLKNLTKMDIVMDYYFSADECLGHVPNLRELGIVICGKLGLK